MPKLSTSARVYIVLLVVLILLRLALVLVPVEFVLEDQAQMVSWPSIVVIWLLGWIGVALAPRAGFAAMWNGEVNNRQRVLVPALVGLGFGVLSVVLDWIQPLGEQIQIPFPGSLIVYPMGGILEEIIFRLLLTTFLVWLIAAVILRRWQEGVFWAVAVAVGGLYALLQVGAYATMVDEVTLLVALRFLVLIGAYFVVAAYVYRRYGFLAAVIMRMGDYLVWHIIWGTLIGGS